MISNSSDQASDSESFLVRHQFYTPCHDGIYLWTLSLIKDKSRSVVQNTDSESREPDAADDKADADNGIIFMAVGSKRTRSTTVSY